jgi:4-phytase / acid phosphatase
MIGRDKVLLLSFLFAFAWTSLNAQAVSGATSHRANPDKLKLVVVLARHGVRSPTWTLDRLNTYSSLPWPAWSVAPGDLTDRGADLLKRFGAYNRASLAEEGLFSAKGCSASAESYIWADVDRRNLASGRAMADSLFPGCAAVVHSLTASDNDPLFHPTANGVDPADTDRIFKEFSKRVADLPRSQYSELLTQMQRVLLGCKLDEDCTPQKPPAIRIMDEKEGVASGKDDKVVTMKGPLTEASSFAEDFLLEYADGMPMESVGWGKVDEAQVRKFLALHSIYFDLIHRTPSIAKVECSNMLDHITRTLQQGVEGKPVAGAIGDPGEKLVLIDGHDTTIAGVATLLGLHWDLDGRVDDTPPGTELIFELWQTPQSTYQVHVSIVMQTLRQLREVQELTLANPPAKQVVTVEGCAGKKHSCAWEEFRTVADTATKK